MLQPIFKYPTLSYVSFSIERINNHNGLRWRGCEIWFDLGRLQVSYTSSSAFISVSYRWCCLVALGIVDGSYFPKVPTPGHHQVRRTLTFRVNNLIVSDSPHASPISWDHFSAIVHISISPLPFALKSWYLGHLSAF